MPVWDCLFVLDVVQEILTSPIQPPASKQNLYIRITGVLPLPFTSQKFFTSLLLGIQTMPVPTLFEKTAALALQIMNSENREAAMAAAQQLKQAPRLHTHDLFATAKAKMIELVGE